ncbi:MAG: hypothetical protein ABI947_03090 [Chloroflexota bacterium]
MNSLKATIFLLLCILLLGIANSRSDIAAAATPASTFTPDTGILRAFSQADALVIGKDRVLRPITRDKDTNLKIDHTTQMVLTGGSETYRISAASKIANSHFVYLVDKKPQAVISPKLDEAANVLQMDLRTGQSKVLFSRKNISEIYISPDEMQVVVTYVVTDSKGETRGARSFCVLMIAKGGCTDVQMSGHFYLSIGWLNNTTFFYTDRGPSLLVVDTNTMQAREQSVKGMSSIDYGAYVANRGVLILSGFPNPYTGTSPNQVFEYDFKANAITLISSASIVDQCRDIDGLRVSPDGRYLSFISGTCIPNNRSWSVVEAKTNKTIVSGIKGTNYPSVQWNRDSSGLYLQANGLKYVDMNTKTISAVPDAPEDAQVIIP